MQWCSGKSGIMGTLSPWWAREREPRTGVWVEPPAGSRGRVARQGVGAKLPWSWMSCSFWTSSGSGKFALFSESTRSSNLYWNALISAFPPVRHVLTGNAVPVQKYLRKRRFPTRSRTTTPLMVCKTGRIKTVGETVRMLLQFSHQYWIFNKRK